MVREIAQRDLDKAVVASGLPVFACVTRAGSGDCFALCLVADNLSEEYEGRVDFLRIDIEDEPTDDPTVVSGIRATPVPSVLLFRNGELRDELVGFHYRADIKRSLDRLIVEAI